jgi:hypothetical protein
MSDVMAFLRSAYHRNNIETLATLLLSRAPNHSIRHALVAAQYLCIKASKATKDLGLRLLTVTSCIKVRLDLQVDKSPIVVKGPFFPRVVNPRYRIRGTNV